MEPLIIVTLLALYKKSKAIAEESLRILQWLCGVKTLLKKTFAISLSELSLFFLKHSLTVMHF